MLGLAGRGSGERSTRSCDRVDSVGLAVTAPGLAVGSIDLDHSDAFATQMSGEASAIGAGALDTNHLDRPEPLQPTDELGVARTPRRERFDTEHTAIRVDRSSNMEVEVGVDPTSDLDVILYDGHGHRFR